MSFFIIHFSHRHGNDIWPVFSEEKPTEDNIISKLKSDDVWDDGDAVEVIGPFDNPLTTPLLGIVESYDSAGYEGCGIVSEEAYKAAKAAIVEYTVTK